MIFSLSQCTHETGNAKKNAPDDTYSRVCVGKHYDIYSRVWVGKHLSDMFPVRIGLKQGDVL
jgi:hypothetical protein